MALIQSIGIWSRIIVLSAMMIACGGAGSTNPTSKDPDTPTLPASNPTASASQNPTTLPSPNSPPSGATTYDTLDAIDTQLLEHVAKTYAVNRQNATKIWNDTFRIDQDILYLVRKDKKADLQGFLFNHPAEMTLKGAQVLDVPARLNLPPVSYFTKANQHGVSAIENFEFDFKLGGKSVFVMKYTDSATDTFSSPTSNDWILFLAHEVFHRYQDSHFNVPAINQNLINYDFSAESIALALLEHRILKAGLTSDSDIIRTSSLHQFVAIRNLRMDKFGHRRISELDNVQEMIEGTARYIEIKFRPFLDDNHSAVKELDMLISNFEEALSDPGFQSGVKENMGFARFYESGATAAFLMDQQNMNWKAQVASGKTPYDFLLSVFGVNNRETLVANAKSQHGYNELIPIAERAAKFAEREPNDSSGL